MLFSSNTKSRYLKLSTFIFIIILNHRSNPQHNQNLVVRAYKKPLLAIGLAHDDKIFIHVSCIQTKTPNPTLTLYLSIKSNDDHNNKQKHLGRAREGILFIKRVVIKLRTQEYSLLIFLKLK